MTKAATVYLVGAGPGDPGLLTRRAAELLARADVVLHDRLVSPATLAGVRANAEVRSVGKAPGRGPDQEAINRELIGLARDGRTVVRLKGGDPFVFGRGGEEADALAAAGIPFEVVPGLTAGLAAPAYAGIPATDRRVSSAVALLTAHEDPAKGGGGIDWAAIASFPGTLVLYMGVARMAAAVERLVGAGRPADEPAAVIERGTYPGQRTVAAPLSQVAERARAEEIRPPAVLVIGEVARMRERLAWTERRALWGLTVVVTRARAQASSLAARLAELGAAVVEAPAIRIEPRPLAGDVGQALERVGDYDLVCVTSPNGARLLLARLAETGRDARALAGVTIAAIGPGTAAALAGDGVRADVVPERAVAEALVEKLAATDLRGRRALVARAAEARPLLPDSLREMGAEVDVVALYDTRREPLAQATVDAIARADYVTFTSGSTVENLLAALEEAGSRLPPEARVVSIGPVTSAAARARGLEIHVEAARHDPEGLLDALVADARERAEARP